MPALAQVSPGPLSKAHASVDGSLKCFQCHGSRAEPMEGRCLDCHKGVAFLLKKDRGLHGRPGLDECAVCHPEHAGADFDLIHWEEGSTEAFVHTRAGWPLKGKHAALRCAQCHQPRFRTSPAAGLSPRSNPSRGWIGLETACGSCHQDPHRGALGEDCSSCHDASAWKPVRGFDHARTSFPLLGRHAPLECAKCHLAPELDLETDAGGHRVPRYKPISHQECASCHADPHQGRLGPSCSSCHTAEDFRKVAETRVDHQRTRYPLKGAHRKVSCQSCHRAGTSRVARPEFKSCGSCHGDLHAGSATLAGKRADCASCHTVDGWTRAGFTVARHTETPYPLNGRHAKVACAACHTRDRDPARAGELGKAAVRIHPAHEKCADCHADSHAGQLAGRPDGGGCEPCHTVEGWKPSLFAEAEHRATSLPLQGAHGRTECAACHGPARRGLRPLPEETARGTAAVALTLQEADCADCHADPHLGRYRTAEEKGATSSCVPCHTVEAFRPSTLAQGDHQRFRFALDGAHRAVPCLDCHEELKAPAAESSLVLGEGPRPELPFHQDRSRCVECHRDPHEDQFSRRSSHGCDGCHTAMAWKPATRFDHDRDAAFALKGEHARVPCVRCHAAREDNTGTIRVAYRLTTTRCQDCHTRGLSVAGTSQ